MNDEPEPTNPTEDPNGQQAVHSEEFERRQAEYLEKLAMRFETLGFTGHTARAFAWFLICDPPEQTAEELGEAIGASRGGVSMATKWLEQMRLVERVRKPGERAVYWKIRRGVWSDLMRQRMENLKYMLDTADEGLELFEDQPASFTKRLREMRNIYGFFYEEFPRLLDHWEQRSDAGDDTGEGK
ncbi:MarR family transcriptional regulator [bacterium]|nr:MarR family transcriptional regulator [bacterium]